MRPNSIARQARTVSGFRLEQSGKPVQDEGIRTEEIIELQPLPCWEDMAAGALAVAVARDEFGFPAGAFPPAAEFVEVA